MDITGLIGRVDAAASILFGGDGAVMLGDFTFQDYEVPERICWPRQQQLVVHRLPGGNRVIDAMGPDPGEIAWSGFMLGPDASDRARELSWMCDAGDAVPLSWGDHVYTVVIGTFVPDEGFHRVDYRITCTVLQEEVAEADPGWLDGIKNDINETLGFDIFAAGSAALGAAQKVAGLAAAVTGGSSAAVSALSTVSAVSGGVSLASGAVSKIASAVDGARSILSASDGGIASIAAAAPSGGLIGSVASLARAANLSGVSAQAAGATGYLGRAARNAASGG
ncbi:conserved protein of unknown function (plasmid) [Rhodovastum atsumiense]|uniref:Uncharacterized protein n=1 Tax=Rhodovastum atsumiense TaxID=504468 RepID=A0A5M6IP23_9PROT|nr:hypothetical protein [Rhodovastum atsumiense]KAA5609649.1 hypothetical protein F1189_23080 [Rhodovastum atsumiense]CAH2606515.1 conserved protein of unknown function [Rhodovastum atsumiense]